MNAKPMKITESSPKLFCLSLVAIVIGVNMLWIDLLPDSSEWRMNVRNGIIFFLLYLLWGGVLSSVYFLLHVVII